MDLPSYIDPDAWQGYVEMRKKIKKPMTERAMTLALTKLEKLKSQGQDPNSVLDQSTFNSWQGLFAVKDQLEKGEEMKKKSAQEELLSALKNKHNKSMPYLTNEAKILFYSINQHWNTLQERTWRGENIFSPIVPDQKTVAAGDF